MAEPSVQFSSQVSPSHRAHANARIARILVRLVEPARPGRCFTMGLSGGEQPYSRACGRLRGRQSPPLPPVFLPRGLCTASTAAGAAPHDSTSAPCAVRRTAFMTRPSAIRARNVPQLMPCARSFGTAASNCTCAASSSPRTKAKYPRSYSPMQSPTDLGLPLKWRVPVRYTAVPGLARLLTWQQS